MGVEVNLEHGWPEYEQAKRRAMRERVEQALKHLHELEADLDELWSDLRRRIARGRLRRCASTLDQLCPDVPERLRVRRRLDTHDAVAAAAVEELVARLERLVARPHAAAAVVEVNEVSRSVPGVVHRLSSAGAGRATGAA